MVKSLLFSLFMAIFAQMAAAQSVRDRLDSIAADTVEPLSDTVAYIYIINSGDKQFVRCITYYQIKDVRDILLEFFNAMMYPSMTQKRINDQRGKLKRT